MNVFERIACEIAVVTAEKNVAYGNSFALSGKILEVLYPGGVGPERYTDLLLTARIIDKLFRIANRKEAFGESPYRDIAGYGLCGAKKDKDGNT